jgi:dihydrolipoamide dehydrogenase
VPLAVLRDTIQPFPTFSEIFVDALHALLAAMRKPAVAPSTPTKA